VTRYVKLPEAQALALRSELLQIAEAASEVARAAAVRVRLLDGLEVVDDTPSVEALGVAQGPQDGHEGPDGGGTSDRVVQAIREAVSRGA